MIQRAWAVIAAIAAAAVLVPAAVGAPTLTGEFEVDGTPGRLAVDADGAAWVSVPSGTHDVARVAPDGTVTHVDLPDIAAVPGITRGPDGRMWAIGVAGVVSFVPADPLGTATFLPIPSLDTVDDLTFGPGGRLYAVATVGAENRMYIIDTGTLPGTLVNAGGTVVPGLQTPKGIAAGGDGKLYIGDFGGEQVVSFDPADAGVVAYPVGGGVQGVAAGPGEQIAYTVPNNQVVGRLTPGGAPQPTTVPESDAFGITLAVDGAYWTPGFVNDTAVRFAADGTFTRPITFTNPGVPPGPRHVAAGADGTVWYSLEFPGETKGKVARIAGLEPPPPPPPPGGGGGGTPPGGGATDPPRPSLTAVTAPRTVKAGRAFVVRARLSAPAQLRIRLDRVLPGRRAAGGRCVAPRPSLRRARTCVRYLRLRSFARQGAAGVNRVTIAPRTRVGALRVGRYRVQVSARGQVPPATAWRSATVRVVPR